MKKLDKKGFTLIEIVVVIVIIAILAAILVPSLLSWIDSAKEKSLISAADTTRNTISGELAELYKDGVDINGSQTNSAFDTDFWDAVSDKAGTTIQCTDSSDPGYVTFTIDNKALTAFSYSDGEKTAIYSQGSSSWEIQASS